MQGKSSISRENVCSLKKLGCLVGWLVGRVDVGWLVGWLVGCLAGWLVG